MLTLDRKLLTFNPLRNYNRWPVMCWEMFKKCGPTVDPHRQ